MSQDEEMGDLVLAFICGAVSGGAVATLYAPASGREKAAPPKPYDS